jgi:hypothetical protein
MGSSLPGPAGETVVPAGQDPVHDRKTAHRRDRLPGARDLGGVLQRAARHADYAWDDDWVEITDSDGRRLAFQQALDLRAPHWPDPERPQQFHLDVMVDEIEDAEKRVLELGAVRLPGEGDDFRVYADPVGHPFCLVWE